MKTQPIQTREMQCAEAAIVPKVFVLVLNWNGWKDTLECLESVFRSDYPNFQVIVCDNDSSDGSLGLVKEWAAGVTQRPIGALSSLSHLSAPPVDKPISYQELTVGEVENGTASQRRDIPLTLIQTGGNLGFAGGNNVGLRYALSQADCSYVWLLNNDTVVEKNALANLVSRISQEPRAGMCGSTLLYFHFPETVQALGGETYNTLTGLSTGLGNGQSWGGLPSSRDIESTLSYICGASMLVSKPFLLSIGLMCEEYFLYFEELDWALRARGKFTLVYAPDSIVYHKEGASIGSGKSAKRSVLAEFYSLRNRLVVTRKFFPWALPTVMAVAWLQVVKRLICGQWSRARLMAEVLLGWRRSPPVGR